MWDRYRESETKVVLIGGVVALLGYGIFYFVLDFGLAFLFADRVETDPTIVVLLLLLATFLPGPIVAGFLHSGGVRRGLRNGIYAAFLGMLAAFGILLLESVLRFIVSPGGSTVFPFGRNFTRYVGNVSGLLVLILAFTGAVGGVLGSIARKVEDIATK